MTQGSFRQSLVASGHAPLPASVKPAAHAPVQYEQAIKALEACQTIDEARYFDNKADALAAWARVYSDDRAAHAARLLKLHAYRRIGELAEQIRPSAEPYNGTKGPRSLLVESGFKGHQAQAALKVARMPAQDFERVVSQPRPPSPSMLVQVDLRKNPAAARVATRFTGLLSILRKTDFDSLVDGMDSVERTAAKSRCVELSKLLARFQARLTSQSARG